MGSEHFNHRQHFDHRQHFNQRERFNQSALDRAIDRAVAAARSEPPRRREDALDRLRSWPRQQEAAAAVARRVEQALAALWEDGWQPADVVRTVARDLAKAETAVVMWAIVAQSVTYQQWGRVAAPEWMHQVDDIVDAIGGRERPDSVPWPLQVPGTWDSTVDAAVQLLIQFRVLWPIPQLTPPPSEWPNLQPAPDRRHARNLDSALLDRIRALLAKAESTDFEAEAEVFTAKAQELMTRHRIDRATLASDGQSNGEVLGRRVGVDDPYARAKSMLLSGIATANGCRTVWTPGLGSSTVFGYPEDIDGVEELFTSLLLQATSALGRQGSRGNGRGGGSGTRRFRRSFWIGFAVRIGERLQQAADETVSKVEEETGRALVPVLASRADAAEEAMQAVFSSNVRSSRISVSDGEGYSLGRQVADASDLDTAAAGRLDR